MRSPLFLASISYMVFSFCFQVKVSGYLGIFLLGDNAHIIYFHLMLSDCYSCP